MIGKQLNFYLTAADQLGLLKSLGRDSRCVLIKRSDDRPYHISDRLEKTEDEWAIAYLCEFSRAEQVLDAVLANCLDSSELLAIEFIHCIEEDGIIRRGRFWYTPKYICDGKWTQKPDDFINWANGILVRTKCELVRHGNGDWMGSEAGSRLEAGKARFSS